MNEIKKFVKSLKFKMALMYSGILLVFCAGFLILMNIFLVDYMERDISAPRIVIFTAPSYTNLNDEKRDLITQSRQNDLQNIRLISIYSILPFVLLSFAGGYLIADNSLKPLEKLNEEIKKKSTKNLGQKIPFKDNGDEISELIQNFNNMSEQLSSAFEAQKEFVENASHELKTPLAVIQANVDSILADSKIPRKDLMEMLDDSKKSLTFMNKLTEDLLLLSLVDVDFEKSKINLQKVLSDAVADARKLVVGKDFGISMKMDSGVEIDGNEVLLRRAFQNLIENSIKYSQGDKLNIEMKKENNEIFVIFKDNGVGIPKESQGKIFDRFYRVDKSRSRKTGGSGLGLAITKEIIQKHKGVIKYVEGKGAEFDISFDVQ
jgi:signal transduction histidine kinase